MKKYLKLLLIGFGLIYLVGCGNQNTPRKKVENLFMKYQKNNESIISELDDYITGLTTTDGYFDEYKKVYLKQYQDLSYEIKDETIDGDNAVVTAQIEVYDYYKTGTLVSNYITTNPDEFNNNGIYDSLKALRYRIDELNKTTDRINYTLYINLTKVNDEWTIDNLTDEDLEKIHGTFAH